jgi:hypothetical protein
MKSCHLQSQAVCLNSLYFSLPLKLLKYDMANNCHMKNCANWGGQQFAEDVIFCSSMCSLSDCNPWSYVNGADIMIG